MSEPRDQLLYSRSARDLIMIAEEYPDIVSEVMSLRPALKKISAGRQTLEEALDAERRIGLHKHEKRLQSYMEAAQNWLAIWPNLQKEISACSLLEAHKIIISRLAVSCRQN